LAAKGFLKTSIACHEPPYNLYIPIVFKYYPFDVEGITFYNYIL